MFSTNFVEHKQFDLAQNLKIHLDMSVLLRVARVIKKPKQTDTIHGHN